MIYWLFSLYANAQQLNSLHQNVLTLTPMIEQTLSTVRDVKDVAPNVTNMAICMIFCIHVASLHQSKMMSAGKHSI